MAKAGNFCLLPPASYQNRLFLTIRVLSNLKSTTFDDFDLKSPPTG